MRLLGPIILAAFALRLFRIDAQGLWSDEGYTALYSALPVGDLLQTISSVDPHPPLYYLLIAAWMQLAGGSDFALRFVSVWCAALTIPTLYVLVRRIGGPIAAAVAATLLAANPFALWYAQEARMYALLGLLATLATLRLHLALERGSGRAWLAWAACLVLAVHTHYYALALVAWHAWLGWRAVLWRPDRFRALAALASIAIAFLPWWSQARALSYGGWMEHVSLSEAARRAAWAFAVGTSIYPEQGWRLAVPTLLAAALGLLVLLARRRIGNVLLLAGWAVVPLLAAYAFGAVTSRASFHERYVSLGAPALLALAALGIVALLRLRWLGGLGSLVLLLAALYASLTAIQWHFTDPRFAKENVRAAASFIGPRATDQDVMIGAPGRLWLYTRYGTVDMPSQETDVVWPAERTRDEMARATAGRRMVWLLPAGADVELEAERWLDARGFRLDGRWFGLAPVKSWLILPDPSAPTRDATLGPLEAPVLAVRDAAFALDEAGPAATLRVAATWHKLRALRAARESLRLVDAAGRTVAQADRSLGGDLTSIDSWPLAAERRLRSALRIPPDLLGGRYQLRLVVYDEGGQLVARPADGGPVGGEWALGEVDLSPRADASPRLVESKMPNGRLLGPSLRLLGADLPDAAILGGSTATVVLHWQALAAGTIVPASLADTRLVVDGRSGSPTDPAFGRLRRLFGVAEASVETRALVEAAPEPGLAERAGPLFRDVRELRLPRDTVAGRHDVALRLGTTQLAVGSLEITASPPRPRLSPPAWPADARFDGAILTGFDLGPVRSGTPTALGIHWRAERAHPSDLSVFVHLVAPDGRIAAQHDGRPCSGACPTTSWEPGDELLDPHPLQLPPASGRYALVVGLYDARTGVRLARVDGPGDSALLTELEVAG